MISLEYIENLDLLSLEAILEKDLDAKKYIGWNYLDDRFKEKLELIGEIFIEEQFEYEYPSLNTYWSKKAPISFSHYPYFGCKLFKSKIERIYFLVYTDFGGNIPEERCRLLQKELIVK